jgi:hypothetical protein
MPRNRCLAAVVIGMLITVSPSSHLTRGRWALDLPRRRWVQAAQLAVA